MTKNNSRLIALFPLPILLTACHAPLPGSTPSSTLQAIATADNAADIEGVLSCYTEDASWIRPGGEVIRGREALRQQYQNLFAASQLNIKIEIDETGSADSVAWVRGRVTGVVMSRTSSAQMPLNDVFLAVFHRLESGEWKLRCLMWTHDTQSESQLHAGLLSEPRSSSGSGRFD